MKETDLRRLLLAEAATIVREGGDPRVEGYRPAPLLERILDPNHSWPEDKTSTSSASRPDAAPHSAPLLQALETSDPIRHLGRYELLSLLDEGGMGRIYEARDRELDRLVAIKLIKETAHIQRSFLTRFVAEARVTGRLQHPSIVPVHDFGVSRHGVLYLVMKKVQGSSLDKVIESLRLDLNPATATWTRHRLLTTFIQVCHAVSYAHEQEVLHRDLKPGNIMLGTFGEVFVMDWGAARLLTPPVGTTSAVIGTPGYMSPEQMDRDRTPDRRSDVWSLGAVLYEILTWQPAYVGKSTTALLAQTVAGPPKAPAKRAPERHIPGEIAEICMMALAPDPEARFASVAELAEAVEGFLEGSRRRERVARQLARAEEHWRQYRESCREFAKKSQQHKELARPLQPWAPLEEKQEWWSLKEQLSDLESDLAASFAIVVALGERALAEEADNADAKAFLARAYWSRFEEAESQGDVAAQRFYEGRVRALDDGRYAEALKGTGALTLRSDPREAEVFCQRVHQKGLIWTLDDPVAFGRTPLERVPLRMGSYLMTLRSAGKEDTRYPVLIGRSHHWDSGPQPVRLYNRDTLGEGFVYVPPGPFLYGGDPELPDTMPPWPTWEDGFLISTYPVTVAQYLDFINALRQEDPDLAWERVPRHTNGPDDVGGQFWERPRSGESYHLPAQNAPDRRWDPRAPIGSVSWYDAMAYAEWASARDGVHYGLPREKEWEKAARGVDGRLFPWGNEFDPTLCRMRDSRPDPPQAEPVGAFPHDTSIYGAHDFAGSAREWCGDRDFDGDSSLRPVRGGAWILDARGCRAAFRNQVEAWRTIPSLTFRLIRRNLDG